MNEKPPIIEPGPTVAPEDLAEARRQKLAAYARASRANNTQASYDSTWRAFADHCEALGVEPEAADVETIGLFLLDIVERGLKAATVRRAFFAIRHHLGRLTGEKNATGDPGLKRILEGILRTLSTEQTRAKALTAPLLQGVVLAASGEKPVEIRDRAMLLVMYAGGLRQSEARWLRACDVEDLGEGFALTLQTTKSSKNQPVRVVVGPSSNAAFCPVLGLRAWMACRPVDTPWLFCGTCGEAAPRQMTYKTLSRLIRRRLEAAGIDPDGFSSHSPRSGLITDLNRANLSPIVVQFQSRHRSSDMLRRYHRPESDLATNYTRAAGL